VPYTLQLTKTSSCSSSATSALQSAAPPRSSTLQSGESSSSAPSSRDSSPYSRKGVLETDKNKFRFEPKQTETISVSGLFRFCSWNQKLKISVCFGVSNLYRNNRNKQNCFVTTRNKPKNPKLFEKYPNILSFKLFGWVFCLFRFNRNIETLCFGIEAKQPKQTFCFR
jgi:hypothetical protein